MSKEKTLFGLISDIESQIHELQKGRAALRDVMVQFESVIEPNSVEAAYLVRDSEHISLLVDITNEKMFNAINELREIVEGLVKKYGQIKEVVKINEHIESI
jgi:hypothetical protein